METITIQKISGWTEKGLAEKITRFRTRHDDSGLETFLLERIDDDDPCCILFRPRFWNEYGLLQIARSRAEEAAGCFLKALTLDSINTSALYNLGTLNMQNGDAAGALTYFESVLSHQPEHFNALFNTGLCFLHDERKEEALPFLLKAADLRPEHGHTRYLSGEILLQLGRAEEALSHFRAAGRDSPDHFETMMGLAISLLKTRTYEEAASICDRALVVFGSATLPLQIKGDAMIGLERFDEAVMCHMDLCSLDLDIRDFVVTRLAQLNEEDPGGFTAYSDVVHAQFPSFKTMLQKALTHQAGKTLFTFDEIKKV